MPVVEGVLELVNVAVAVMEGVAEGVPEPVPEAVAVGLGEPVSLPVAVGDAVGVSVGVPVGVAVMDAVPCGRYKRGWGVYVKGALSYGKCARGTRRTHGGRRSQRQRLRQHKMCEKEQEKQKRAHFCVC